MPMQLRNRSINVDGEIDVDSVDKDDDFILLEDDTTDTSKLLSKSSGPEVHVKKPRGVAGDGKNIAVLLFLYVLQGIPLGLGAAIPLILTNRQVSYKQQAEFSFAYWPFSIKLLWAPIVDSLFVARFGRRKTWLVPVQYLIGITMLILAKNVNYYLNGEGNDSSIPDVFTLTCMFFFLNFLAATQDIAVDGWALTMLQRHNVGYASTCNSVGQTAGYFIGYIGYMALESYNILQLPEFLTFWGYTFIVVTTLVAIFKHESNESTHKSQKDATSKEDEELELGIMDTYKMLFKMIMLPLMPATIIVLLTSKIGFSAADAVSGLKLIERGVPKDKLAMLAVPVIPLQIVLPWIISRYTVGPRPMDVFLKAMPPRLLMGLVYMGMVWITPSFQDANGDFPIYYYIMIVAIYMVHQVFLYSMFVSIMAFFARISDPAVGGTYMTFLNTLTNLGGNWPATLALWWVDVLTYKKCDISSLNTIKDTNLTQTQLNELSSNICHDKEHSKICESSGGKCKTEIEGYYVESVCCVIIGFLWLGLWGWRTIKRLQEASEADWRVVGKIESNEKHK